jgi:hypothetical protein
LRLSSAQGLQLSLSQTQETCDDYDHDHHTDLAVPSGRDTGAWHTDAID